MKTEKQFTILAFLVVAATLLLATNALAWDKLSRISEPWTYAIFLAGGVLLEIIDRVSKKRIKH